LHRKIAKYNIEEWIRGAKMSHSDVFVPLIVCDKIEVKS
jgi:hypothetical protein